ncbi:Uroporphyrin-III C/tetrapyrrole (Corrin/Porphyrin) methyltransferase [Melioribacter roseus P3M-2]|jgi:16S rRNA (cytidine1402-2'-O)-methyltransferase|uniref:Ribosomal RNA small subunit methyltransferase I n=1 Tax=Melioribacter roseus (strain DSM 23840 / JCM 17771 / VKM B-2668 / P3M-2) TaxID=1191523 RepID=I6Z5I7_MELRP|nr:16S rRNA (cytidine(1402)-2'-O)-methyltransferase [Melioribacter roseus]AFN74415.1 Uroporphyrin-III C/tetrapyrrole (Corrin/Porphyrin) methyltransferase [Melioribacter roseus P3M-2]
MKPKLYIVSTPIGNYEDITLRALKILRGCDFIICEEYREANRLLSEYDIKKELYSLNEHNEEENSYTLLEKIRQAESVALISDCGTPLFSDPGTLLVQLAIKNGIEVIPVPGSNSLMAALVGSGFDFKKFYYAGWISPKKDLRRRDLMRLKEIKELIVLMETPYRLVKILEDVTMHFGSSKQVVLAYNLTQKDEEFIRGTAGEALNVAKSRNLKGEFVLIIDNRR